MNSDNLLARVPLFENLGREDVDKIFKAARRRNYPKNQVILFEDDHGDALYVVATGQVKVVLTGENGREVILSVLGEGDFFGEMSLIDDEPRSAHVIAMEDCELLVLLRDDFLRCLKEASDMSVGLLRAMSQRLRRADDKIGNLVLLDVGARVARLILQLADDQGGDTINRSIPHNTMAQMIGSSRETVSRTFRDLSEKGIIEITRETIVISDREGLKQAAGIK